MADADRRFDGAADQPARLGDAKMQRAIHSLRQPHIGRYGEEDVRRLHGHLIFVETLVLEPLDMIERAFDQPLVAWPAIFFGQVIRSEERRVGEEWVSRC